MQLTVGRAWVEYLGALSVARVAISSPVWDRTLALIGALQLVLLIQSMTMFGYLGVNPIASLSYFANDSHCQVLRGEGIGTHCFGDYAFVRNAILDGNPWEEPALPYPAASLFPFFFGLVAETIFGSFNSGLFFYLGLLALAVSTPWIVLFLTNSNLSWSTRILSSLVIGPLSLPALITLDRGNSIGFVLPALLFFSMGVLARSPVVAATGIVIAIVVKPQFALLLLIFIAMKKWSFFWFGMIISLILQGAAYAAFQIESLLSNFLLTLRNVASFSGSQPEATLYPINVSLFRPISELVSLFEFSFATKFFLPVWGGFLAATILLLVFLSGKGKISLATTGLSLLVLASLSTPVTWGYYLVFSQAGLFIVLAKAGFEGVNGGRAGQKRSLDVVDLAWLTAISFSLTSLLLPIVTSGHPTFLSTHFFSPYLWLLALTLTIVRALPGNGVFQKMKIYRPFQKRKRVFLRDYG